MSKIVLIGVPDITSETDWGSTYKKGASIFGYNKAEYVDGHTSRYDWDDDVAAAISHAKPGVSTLAAGAQATQELQVFGKDDQSEVMKLQFRVNYDVQVVAYGGSASLTTRVYAYDLNKNEYVERDRIRAASHGTMVAGGWWETSGEATEDIYIDNVENGDRYRVGVQVMTVATAAAVSGAYADAYGPYLGDDETEHVSLEEVAIMWP